ncbi:MAG: VWA domain-containing protein [candidate division FCPU426 bacterium]
MDYGHPQYLAWRPFVFVYLGVAAALALQQAWVHRKYIEPALAGRFGPAYSLPRALLKAALTAAALWFLATALATPLGQPIKIDGESNGADLILAVDVSSSMYAGDVPPSRLGALKSALATFVTRLGGDRVGLVAFAGDAVIACPLTTDYDTVNLFLEKLESDSVPSDGTGFGPALKLCLDGFKADPKRGRMIVLATDGEDTLDSDAGSQARRAGSLGIPVFTIGVGTQEGAYIPGRPDIFGQVRPKMYQGKPVRVRVNPDTLKKIASLSGGEYFDGASPTALQRAYERVRSLKQGKAKAPDRYQREPLYQKPLLWAVILFLVEMMLSNRVGKKIRWAFWRVAALLLLFLVPGTLPAFSLDPGRGEYDEANAQYRQGQYDKAGEDYERSLAKKPKLMSGHYNLGNSKFMRQDYEGAIRSYEEALALDPKDPDAQHNLALAKKRLEQKKQGKDPDPKKDKKGDKDGKNQQQGQGGQSQPGGGQGKNQGQAKPNNQGGPDQDQIQAMMNMLKNDQRRYGSAFQPLKKRQEPPDQNLNPAEEMFEQLTGQKLRKTAPSSGPEKKDW